VWAAAAGLPPASSARSLARSFGTLDVTAQHLELMAQHEQLDCP
jgi:hypothetical protein